MDTTHQKHFSSFLMSCFSWSQRAEFQKPKFCMWQKFWQTTPRPPAEKLKIFLLFISPHRRAAVNLFHLQPVFPKFMRPSFYRIAIPVLVEWKTRRFWRLPVRKFCSWLVSFVARLAEK